MSDSNESDLELLMELSDADDAEMDYEFEYLKTYKRRINYMSELNSYEFTYRFRLNKTAVSDLLEKIYPRLKVTSKRNHGISPLHQLLLTLRFYALGTMLVSVADFIGVSRSSAGRIVANVSAAIAGLYSNYIYIHANTQEDFYNIARFPRVLGAIDGTHILIQSPNANIGEEFRNRKGYFSINVQAVCDAHLRFMNVVARWPGSTHDATIFNNSTLRAECENGLYGNRWLIGDSAYPCKPYLLTPLINPISEGQHMYNESHIRTRNTIERCFGVWKRRFPVVSLKIRLSFANTQNVIIATTVLHNICRQMNIEDVEPEVEIVTDETVTIHVNNTNEDININERQDLINNYFSSS